MSGFLEEGCQSEACGDGKGCREYQEMPEVDEDLGGAREWGYGGWDPRALDKEVCQSQKRSGHHAMVEVVQGPPLFGCPPEEEMGVAPPEDVAEGHGEQQGEKSGAHREEESGRNRSGRQGWGEIRDWAAAAPAQVFRQFRGGGRLCIREIPSSPRSRLWPRCGGA